MSIVARMAHALETVFSQAAEEANQEAGVILRRRKFTPVSLAKTFVLGLLTNPHATHEDLAAAAAAADTQVSPQAIEQRYSPQLCKFLECLLPRMLCVIVRADESLAPLLERFTEVKILDSSSVQLPDSEAERFPASGGAKDRNLAVVKLQTEFELCRGQLLCLQFEPGKANDQGTNRQHVPPRPGSLRIADLGYFSVPVLASLAAASAYFLTRVQHHVKIHVEGVTHGLVEWLNQQPERIVDRNIALRKEDPLACRLIAWRVPQEIADRRRAKLREKSVRKTGREPSRESLAACDWEFLVTNLPEEKLSVKEAIVLYRARWQIELLFKRWKSIGKIAVLDGKNDVTKMCRFWARLCAAVVQHWLTVCVGWSTTLALSFAKLAHAIATIASELASAIGSLERDEAVLEKLRRQAIACCRRNKRRKPGAIELLRNPELLEYALT